MTEGKQEELELERPDSKTHAASLHPHRSQL